MKRLSIFRLCLSLSFTLVVMTTVSFHEVHYLFTHHAEHEHCENHLHANDHNHCSVCKFDVSVFTDDLSVPLLSEADIFPVIIIAQLYAPILLKKHPSNLLRGPPALA